MSTFGARDLALLLPNEVEERVSRNPQADEVNITAPQPKLDPTKKTRRYFPGKTPTWADNEGEEEEVVAVIDTRPTGEVTDRRLSRLARVSDAPVETSRRRRIYQAEVIADTTEETRSSTIEDGLQEGDVLEGDSKVLELLELREETQEEIAARRERIKNRLSSRIDISRHEYTAPEIIQEQQQAQSESEYETDSDYSEEESGPVLMKPVFVPRHRRETINEQLLQAAELEKRQEIEVQVQQQRKQATRVMVAESVRRFEEKQNLDATDVDSDAGLPDDTDAVDAEACSSEYENWKLREIARLKRDADHRAALAAEMAELERRRNLSEEERYAEDVAAGRFAVQEKAKWKFLQKYYHKGVFYMDEDTIKDKSDVRAREYNEPTLEDKVDKERLPTVMQVKNFGKRGRTKYTHLNDQDTTR